MKANRFKLKRFFTPASLQFQLLSRALFILSILLLLIGVFQFIVMQQFIYRNKADSLKTELASINPGMIMDTGRKPAPGERRPPAFFSPDSALAFIDETGTFTTISNGPDRLTAPKLSDEAYQTALQITKENLNYRIVNETQGEAQDRQQLVVLQRLQDHGRMIGIVQVSVSTKPLNDLLIQQLMIYIALSILALVLGLLSLLPLLRKTLDPLRNMAHTVQQIDAGNLNERFLTQQGQIEIDRLSVSFNSMLGRLEASFEAEKEAKEQMRRFIADASHELRTPLTSIHGFLEVLLRGAAGNPDQLHRALKSMLGESTRINKLVEELILLAKLDRTPSIELEEGQLDEVILEMKPQLLLLAGEREVSFALAPHAACMFDKDKMKQVILNLFQNAVQHTDANKGHIQIALAAEPEYIELAIADNGSGISEEHLPHVFDRFYRIESSRARISGGAGLGLSITKSIVEINKGTIQLESREGEGSTIRIRLPRMV
jgi:two-component system OmpR family sensor kinase